MHSRTEGKTLIELLAVLALATLLAIFSLPAFQALVARQQVIATSNQLQGLIYFAREHALSQGNSYLCDLQRGCSQFGQTQGIGIFRQPDFDNEKKHEMLLLEYQLPENITLTWNRFRGNHLHFALRGVSHFQNGHFLICHKKQKAARKIVMNWIGRSRIEPADPSLCHTP